MDAHVGIAQQQAGLGTRVLVNKLPVTARIQSLVFSVVQVDIGHLLLGLDIITDDKSNEHDGDKGYREMLPTVCLKQQPPISNFWK